MDSTRAEADPVVAVAMVSAAEAVADVAAQAQDEVKDAETDADPVGRDVADRMARCMPAPMVIAAVLVADVDREVLAVMAVVAEADPAVVVAPVAQVAAAHVDRIVADLSNRQAVDRLRLQADRRS